VKKRVWIGLRRFVTMALALFLGAMLLMAVGYLAVGLLVGTGEEVEVPNVIGQEYGTAMEILLTAGLKPLMPIESDYHDEIEPEHIIQQAPLPGSLVKRGREVRLVKSQGSMKVQVPSLIGLDLRGAEWELRRRSLRLGHLTGVSHEEVEEGLIFSQEPFAAARLAKGSMVDLLISDGPPPRLLILPDVRGRKVLQARERLERIGFARIRENPVVRPGKPPGIVLGQHPAPGVPLAADQDVVLAVSTARMGWGKAQYRYFSYELPRALGPGRVQLFVLDEAGFRLAREGNYKRGGRMEFIERIVGDAAIVIYQDGLRVLEDYVLSED